MSHFSEAQLERVFVELFMEQGYEYVHGDSISRDVRDVLLPNPKKLIASLIILLNH